MTQDPNNVTIGAITNTEKRWFPLNMTCFLPFVLAILLAIISIPVKSAEYQTQYNLKSWQQWHKEYEQTVSGKGGWLSLAGLYWLTEGLNTFGSSKTNHHQFPAGTPAHLGTINLNGDSLEFSSLISSVKIDNKPQIKATLSVEDKTLVSFAQFEFYIIKREIGYAIRLLNNESKKQATFLGTQFYPFKSNWVLPAKLLPHAKPSYIAIPTVYGTVRNDSSAGWLEFMVDGKTHRFQAVNYGKDTPLYVMFSDHTNDETTYGAGRYIEVDWPDQSGNTVIDFNRAYNPACAFTEYATCPLTPRQNRLNLTIDAGEYYIPQ